MKNKLRQQEGFTLTELIVVIAIIAILAAVLIPSITSYIKKARRSADMQEGKSVLGTFDNYLAERRMINAGEPFGSFAAYYEGITEKPLGNKKFIVVLAHEKEIGEDPLALGLIAGYKYVGKYYIVSFPADKEDAEITYVLLEDDKEGIDTINEGDNEGVHWDLATEHLFEIKASE